MSKNYFSEQLSVAIFKSPIATGGKWRQGGVTLIYYIGSHLGCHSILGPRGTGKY